MKLQKKQKERENFERSQREKITLYLKRDKDENYSAFPIRKANMNRMNI